MSDVGLPAKRLPTLVQYCVKVASLHVDSISSLGHSVPYELVKPILESCSAENLFRLEDASPHLKRDTDDLWKEHCLRKYSLASEPYTNGALGTPSSWRDQFYNFRDREAQRFEAIGSRMKIQRLEAEERKQEKKIKLTDRVPPTKRGRGGWNTLPQPKSLIQRTRTEASKIQKSMFGAQMRPPMLGAKSYRVVTHTQSAKLPAPPPSESSSGSRVVVRPVVIRQPAAQSIPPKALPPAVSRKACVPEDPHVKPRPTPAVALNPVPLDILARPGPAGSNAKKGPRSSLFMPKHRAHSQLPSRSGSSRGSPTK